MSCFVPSQGLGVVLSHFFEGSDELIGLTSHTLALTEKIFLVGQRLQIIFVIK